ncbi:MAG: ParB N-terminal domain-containing protein [Ktedonobacteraceae bacterium]|nr:ParB N-terminal domain-containing protein [Ktedonobacteraceae bacterium]
MAYEEKHLLLSLHDLISLKDAHIPAGAFAMRPLDQTHIEQLVESDSESWPEIETTLSTQGYIVIDGYHRWEAAKIKQLEHIKAIRRTYASEQEIIEAAFQANLKHGLKASIQARGDYAYWLHLSFPAIDQVEIARRVGMTQGGVSKAIKKREELAKHVEQHEGKVDEQERQRVMQQSCKHFARGAIRFLDEVKALSDEELLQIFQEIVKKEEKIKLIRVARLLSGNPPMQMTGPLRLRQFASSNSNQDPLQHWTSEQ